MRILLVELSPSGGLFQFSYQLGKHLGEHGHSVELLTGPEPELRGCDASFRVLDRLPTWHPGAQTVESRTRRRLRRVGRAGQHVAALAQVLAHLRRTRPDVVLWHPLRFPLDAWTVLLARRLAPSTEMGLVLHEPRPLAEQRRDGSFYKSGRLVTRSTAAALASLDVLFVLGEQARSLAREHWGDATEVVVIPHGDEAVFLGDEQDVMAVGHTPPRVLFFGTWTRHKGIETLLTAFAQVRAEVPEAQLVLAGAVAGDVDFEEIRRRARQVGGVDLRPGYVAMSEVPALMGSARVVAVPYLRANQSGVAHLAQTFGRPVVASRVGDIPAAVPDGEAGLLVPPGDADALAVALRTLLLDPATAARLGTAGRERLRRQGSWRDVAARVADAVEGRRTTPPRGRPA